MTMKWTDINKEKLGQPLYVTPNYDDANKRSCIDYCSGIPELDNPLAEAGKPFSAMNVEMGILIYEDILMFLLVRGSKAKGHFSISRDRVIRVNAIHGQMLNIRKDPGRNLGMFVSIAFGIFGAIAAATADLIKSKVKNKPVLGSKFEIVLDSTNNSEYEKIIIACTNKNKEMIEKVCDKIIKS
jgi:hypothetical protein